MKDQTLQLTLGFDALHLTSDPALNLELLVCCCSRPLTRQWSLCLPSPRHRRSTFAALTLTARWRVLRPTSQGCSPRLPRGAQRLPGGPSLCTQCPSLRTRSGGWTGAGGGRDGERPRPLDGGSWWLGEAVPAERPRAACVGWSREPFPAAELPARGERPSRAVRPDLGGTAYFEERGLDQGSTAPTPRTVTVGSQSRCPL